MIYIYIAINIYICVINRYNFTEDLSVIIFNKNSYKLYNNYFDIISYNITRRFRQNKYIRTIDNKSF